MTTRHTKATLTCHQHAALSLIHTSLISRSVFARSSSLALNMDTERRGGAKRCVRSSRTAGNRTAVGFMGGNDRCLVSCEVLTRFPVDTSPVRPPHSLLPMLWFPGIPLSALPITRHANPPDFTSRLGFDVFPPRYHSLLRLSLMRVT